MYTLFWHRSLLIAQSLWLICSGTASLVNTAQASRDTAASAVADQLRRDQLALKQSKQLIPILAPASKGKPYKSPAAAHSTATAHANGNKTSALLNGGLPRKSSLESLGRMNNQVNMLICSVSALCSHSYHLCESCKCMDYARSDSFGDMPADFMLYRQLEALHLGLTVQSYCHRGPKVRRAWCWAMGTGLGPLWWSWAWLWSGRRLLQAQAPLRRQQLAQQDLGHRQGIRRVQSLQVFTHLAASLHYVMAVPLRDIHART